MFYGSIVALVTPFSYQSIDKKALAKLTRFHLQNETNAIVVAGTTGEALTLSCKEYQRSVELVVNEVAGQIPVIAGAGSNNPDKHSAVAAFSPGAASR